MNAELNNNPEANSPEAKHSSALGLLQEKPYILLGGRYILAEGPNATDTQIEYLTEKQVERINNLLIAKLYIDNEIQLIKKSGETHPEVKLPKGVSGVWIEKDTSQYSEPQDEMIAYSRLSNRTKNVFWNKGFKKLSDVAKHPIKKWADWRGMGIGAVDETKNYLLKRNFILNK